MTERFKASGQVAIVGYGQSPVYRRAPVPLAALAVEACQKAIADAGLTVDQINGVASYPTLPAQGPHGNVDGQDIVTATYMSMYLGIRPQYRVDYEGGGQIGSALIQAVNAIASGAADNVLVFRALHNPPGRYHAFTSNVAAGNSQWSAPHGLAGVAGIIGFPYREYMERYGATDEELATLVSTIRMNTVNNPQAYWHGQPLTREEYLNGRMVGDPIRIFDCDIPIDGAGAFVLTSAERAKDTPHKPVYVAGFVQTQVDRPRGNVSLDGIMDIGLTAGKRLWEHTGLSPKDINCPQLYDGYAQLNYFWLESLGFCKVGEAHSWIQNGKIDVNGDFPLLSGGGNIGNGRLHGVGHIRENYLQLSGRAGDRQLKKATLGISSHSFPDAGAAIVFSSEPLPA